MPSFSLSNIFTKHHEVARKTMHITFAAIFLATHYYVGPGLTAGAAVAVAVLLLTIHAQRLFRVVYPYMSILYDVGRRSWGEVYYAVGIAIAALLTTSTTDFGVVLAITAFADSAASLVGKSLSSPKLNLVFAEASVGGSAAFFVVACVVLVLAHTGLPIISLSVTLIVLTATTLTAIEAVSPYGADNALIPLMASLMLFVWN